MSLLTQQVNHDLPMSRFEWVMAGCRSGPDTVFDHDLADMSAAAVLPTKGALVAEWLLVVPRVRAASLAELPLPDREAVLDCAKFVGRRVTSAAGNFVMFEHGAGRIGSISGCGVDQAHLHVVGLNNSFVDSILQSPAKELTWKPTNIRDPWVGIGNGSDYIVLLSGKEAWRALTPNPVSQFMRRRIADFVGKGNEWDYRRYAHVGNAERTRAIFNFRQGASEP